VTPIAAGTGLGMRVVTRQVITALPSVYVFLALIVFDRGIVVKFKEAGTVRIVDLLEVVVMN